MKPEDKHQSFNNITWWSGNRDEGSSIEHRIIVFIIILCHWNFKETMHMLVLLIKNKINSYTTTENMLNTIESHNTVIRFHRDKILVELEISLMKEATFEISHERWVISKGGEYFHRASKGTTEGGKK